MKVDQPEFHAPSTMKTTIRINGKDRTAQIKDWSIEKNGDGEDFFLRCTFHSGKFFPFPLNECEVSPYRELSDVLMERRGRAQIDIVQTVKVYGERYALIQYEKKPKVYILKWEDIKVSPKVDQDADPVFAYLAAVASARCESGSNSAPNIIWTNVVRQLHRLLPSSETALHAYCTGRSQRLNGIGGGHVYPFGINRSQINAVEAAFRSQISVIEGPPGTGKTQTILTIVANAVVAGKTVAVVSQGNSAVDNVWEKLNECGLGHLMAQLGSSETRDKFFEDPPPWPVEEVEQCISLSDLQELKTKLDRLIDARTTLARLQAEIREIMVESERLRDWRNECGLASVVSFERYRLSPSKAADLMAYFSYMQDSHVRLKDRVELLFKFKIFRTKFFASREARLAAFFELQVYFYEKILELKKGELEAYEQLLREESFEHLKDRLTKESMRYFKWHLHLRAGNSADLNARNYKNKFDEFINRFPIIGSSTHSIVNSIAQGTLLDYVIIDEASMQDIVPGILALGCAKNAIIVGDSKQLPHIPQATGLEPPSNVYDCEKHSLLKSCSLVFSDRIPRTLLREHYRCDPRIIEFCNQQFYGGELIPMVSDSDDTAMMLIVTSKGNNARGNANQRELDSYLEVEKHSDALGVTKNGRGFIAPYRAQVDLAERCLPSDFVRRTVHKFQGRECDEIVYSTVLDKKRVNQEEGRQAFVDDPCMVNVAVSRAKKRFTLTTGDRVFSNRDGSIAALIRYIEYYSGEQQIFRAPVVSAFDLLYSEYDKSLEELNLRLCPGDSKFKSEQIVAATLRLEFSARSRKDVSVHSQVRLIQLISERAESLTEREKRFMRNGASCDFVLYFTVGKRPFAVIEVDGGSHDRAEQMERDRLKNSILEKASIQLLRLRTTESDIQDKISSLIKAGAGDIV